MKELEKLRQYVQDVGLKNSRQREAIALHFFRQSGHVTAEEMLALSRKNDDKVSLATVYRTLKLLQECGLARTHHFGDGHARYEPLHDSEAHHDHLVCTSCRKIVEFSEPKLEIIQENVAKKAGFVVTQHRMELFGLCPDCQKG